jgi:hypothetical protein
VKRLSLGLCLIALSSSVLLISDWNQRKTADPHAGRKWKIQLVEFNNVLDVEESEEGVLDGLRSQLVEGRDFEIKIGNAQGDMASVRTVGTLFVPAEVNMVVNKDILVGEGKKAGIEVVTVAVSTSTEVSDAALAMVSRKIDAVCQIGGNLTAASFGGISQAARKAKLPVFSFQKSQALGGAAVTLARDYYDVGRAAGLDAVRIIRGESAARIPIQSFSKTNLIINRAAARAVGLNIPQSVMKRNPEIIGN